MKNFLKKVVTAFSITASITALSSVYAWAYDYEYTIATPATKTVDAITVNNTTYGSVNHNNGSKDSGAKFDKATGKKINTSYDGSFAKSAGGAYYIGINAEAGDTISLISADSDVSWKMVKAADLNGNYTSNVEDVTAYDTQTTITDGKVTFKKIQTAGTYLIYNTFGSSRYVKTIKSVSGTPDTTYTVSGSVTNNDGYTGTLTIGSENVSYGDSSYSVSLADGTYDVSLSSSLYEVSPTTITVKGGNVTQNITIKKLPTMTISGTIDPNLGISEKIEFIYNTTKYTATIDGNSYSVVVPQNTEYKISVLEDSGYKTSAYKIDQITVATTNSKTLTCNLTGTKITSWKTADVNSTMPDVTIQKTTGTYKGITIDAKASYKIGSDTRNGKWASSNGQTNSGTILTIPLDPKTQQLSLDVKDDNNVGYTVTYTDTAGVITVNNYNTENNAYSIYINKIEIIDKAATIASTVEKITSNGDYYALDTANNKVYIIHPVKSTDDYKTAEKLVLYNSQSTELAKTDKIYKTIQFAEGDTLSISDLNDDTIVGLYAVSERKESPTAPTSANYSWKLEKSEK